MKGILKKVAEATRKIAPGTKGTKRVKGPFGKAIAKLEEEGKLKNVAEKTVASATGMKRGGAVDKMGRAVKRKTADVKGRAMKGK
jgi:hypothetical protein